MFTGLIEHRGTVVAADGAASSGMRLLIELPLAIAGGVRPGDSVAIDGACLTVVECTGSRAAFDVVPETLARTTLAALRAGEAVNVELALRAGDRLGGHFVYGHVDATARIVEKRVEGQGWRLVLATPPALGELIAEKAFIALDGVSLTVAAVRDATFEIALIPETAKRTGFGTKSAGDRVNLEIDPLARYAMAAARAYLQPAAPAGSEPSASPDELAWAYEI